MLKLRGKFFSSYKVQSNCKLALKKGEASIIKIMKTIVDNFWIHFTPEKKMKYTTITF